MMQDDVAELLRVLGISDHARPVSPHRVVQDEIIPAIKFLRDLMHARRMAAQDAFEPLANVAWDENVPSRVRKMARDWLDNHGPGRTNVRGYAQHVATEDAPEPPATERERDELDEIERLVSEFGEAAARLGRWQHGIRARAHHRMARAALLSAIRARLRAPQGEPPDQPIHTAPDAELFPVPDAAYEMAILPPGEPDPEPGVTPHGDAFRWCCKACRVEVYLKSRPAGWVVRGDNVFCGECAEPDPDLMEAWADWYDATYHRGPGESEAASHLRRAAIKMRDDAFDDIRAHRDATGDTP